MTKCDMNRFLVKACEKRDLEEIKTFVICADGAESDGYVLFWSEDTKETVIKRK